MADAKGSAKQGGSTGPTDAALAKAPGVVRFALKPALTVLAIFTTAKSFRRNPIIGSPTLNAMGLHVFRVLLAHGIMGARMRIAGLFAPAADRRAFLRDGIVVKPDFLPPDLFEATRREVFGYNGRVREFVEGEAKTRRALFDDGDAQATPATLSLEDYRPLRRLMTMASGGAPPVWSVECVVHGADDPQTILHSDSFHPSSKCWLYLEDVGPAEGPFVFTPGSNRLTWKRLVWEYRRSLVARDLRDGHSENGSLRADDAVLAELGLPPARPYPVKANTLVVANTYGFHRRSVAPPGAVRRAIYAFARGNPFLPVPAPPAGVATGLLKAGRRRYFAWLDEKVRAGRVPGRRVYDGALDS
ncbi:MAG: phytanoyl-CoA dioxygenase [Alphaproteobacteria bacterium]